MRTILVVLLTSVLLASTVTVQAQEQQPQPASSVCLSEAELQPYRNEELWDMTEYTPNVLEGVRCVSRTGRILFFDGVPRFYVVGNHLYEVGSVRREDRGSVFKDLKTNPPTLRGSNVVRLRARGEEVAIRRFDAPFRLIQRGEFKFDSREDLCQLGFEARGEFFIICTVTQVPNFPFANPVRASTPTSSAMGIARAVTSDFAKLFRDFSLDKQFWEEIALLAKR